MNHYKELLKNIGDFLLWFISTPVLVFLWFIKYNKTPVDDSLPPSLPPEPKSKIHEWALAIQEFEGYAPGSVSFRNNNPGNIKGLDGKFLKFPSYEVGLSYLEDYLIRASTGKHAAYKPEFTLKQFFATYAPDGDKIITNYSNFVASKLGVFPSIKIKELV